MEVFKPGLRWLQTTYELTTEQREIALNIMVVVVC